MTKVAALYIATGRYTVFWPEFYESAEKYLLKDCEVHYFVFTDAATLPGTTTPACISVRRKPTPGRLPRCAGLRFFEAGASAESV